MVEKCTAVLQESASQLPPKILIVDVTVPEDAGLQILTEVLDQKFGRRHGKIVWCMRKAQVRETGASSSKSATRQVNTLKEEVATLKGQLSPGRADEYDCTGITYVRPPNPNAST